MMERLRLKGRALRGLRLATFPWGKQDSGMILRTSKYMFNAAVKDRNVIEAKMHGRIFRDILHVQAAQQGVRSINTNFLVRTVFKDAILSEYSQTPTIFDVDTWQPVLEAGLALKEDMSPDPTSVSDESAYVELRHDFRPIFLDVRQALQAFSNPSVLDDMYLAQKWAYVRLVVAQSRAVNVYAQLCREGSGGTHWREPSRCITVDELGPWVEACLASAVLLFVSLLRCAPE